MGERLSINVSDLTASSLRELSQRREATVTETVRRAVAVLKLLEDAELAGKELRFHDRKSGSEEIVRLV
jgi:hypothetical protein